MHFLGLLGALGTPLVSGCTAAQPYAACSRDEPCSGDAPLCLANTSATRRTMLICTLRCDTPSPSSGQCPENGACVRLNGGDPVCMQKCTLDGDCRHGEALCAVLSESMGQRVCTVRP